MLHYLARLLSRTAPADSDTDVDAESDSDSDAGSESSECEEGPIAAPPLSEVAKPGVLYPVSFESIEEAYPEPPFVLSSKLLCANGQDTVCHSPGVKACARCKLVSYCSKECQVRHWPLHKNDCKSPLRSEDWTPCWMLEGRPPIFRSTGPLGPRYKDIPDIVNVRNLWGLLPAFDLVNSQAIFATDLSLAFLASGELRNVVKTVNELPCDYSGTLTVLLSGTDSGIICRSIMLLVILGTLPSSQDDLSVDVALHFWYSILYPSAYDSLVTRLVNEKIFPHFFEDKTKEESPLSLGPTSTLHVGFTEAAKPPLFQRFYEYSKTATRSRVDAEGIRGEYNRARSRPATKDCRDDILSHLDSSHRLAFARYREDGLLLPFGSTNRGHFDAFNPSLFSLEGRWLQHDLSDPLDGWQTNDVLAGGKAHGTQSEDIYGCLYFYLSDQLREFRKRIRRFHIAFKVALGKPQDLASSIKSGSLTNIGVPPSIRFDRIDVDSAMDAPRYGVSTILDAWAPLLGEGKDAVLVGCFRVWPRVLTTWHETETSAQTRGQAELHVMSALTDSCKRRQMTDDQLEEEYLRREPCFAIGYDYSGPFDMQMVKQGVDGALRRNGIVRRTKHKIVPHRLLVPIDAPPTAVPKPMDTEEWYINVDLGAMYKWTERYVEFSRA